MFRELRRKRQALPQEACEQILKAGKTGVLALQGDDDYPYAVPLNYCYEGGKLYFHCAKSGHKIDAVKRCSKASFCVVAQDDIVSQEFTTYFRSVIAFGKVRILADEGEKLEAINTLAIKYCPGESAEARRKEIERGCSALCILEFTIEHLSGKQAIELCQGTPAH